MSAMSIIFILTAALTSLFYYKLSRLYKSIQFFENIGKSFVKLSPNSIVIKEKLIMLYKIIGSSQEGTREEGNRAKART